MAVVVVRFRKIRRERNRLREALGGFGGAAKIEKRGSAIAPVRDRARILCERAVEAFDRRGETAERDERIGAAAMRTGAAERDGAIEACQRLFVTAGAAERHTEQTVGARVVRIERD